MKLFEQGYIIRLRRDINVYKFRKNILIFRRGNFSLRFDFEQLNCTIHELVELLSNGVKHSKLQEILELDDNIFSDFINALLQRSMVVLSTVCAEDGTESSVESFLETVKGYGYLSERIVREARSNFAVRLFGPEQFCQPLQKMLSRYDVQADVNNFTWNDKSIKMPIQEKLAEQELYVVHLGELDYQLRLELTSELVKRKIAHIPVHKDGDNPWIVGPMHMNENACLGCYESRRRGNLTNPMVLRLIHSDQCTLLRKGSAVLTPVSLGFTVIVSCFLSLRFLFPLDSPFESRDATIYEIFDSGQISTTVVHRDPFCECCAPGLRIPGTREFQERRQMSDTNSQGKDTTG